jgi:hypothetical protein
VFIKIVPDGVAQVGCVTLEEVGTAGGVGMAVMVMTDPEEVIQVVSAVFLTNIV